MLQSIKQKVRRQPRGEWFFRFTFVFQIVLSFVGVKLILWLASRLGIKPDGPYIAGGIFAILFIAIGVLQLRRVDQGQRVHDWILRASCRLSPKHWKIRGFIGNLIVATILGTSASAYALKQLDHSGAIWRTVLGGLSSAALLVTTSMLVSVHPVARFLIHVMFR